jgi:hypothetical protein
MVVPSLLAGIYVDVPSAVKNAAQSDAVKSAWRRHTIDIKTQHIVGFDPTTMTGLALPEHIAADEFPTPEFWGLITTTGRLFALKVYFQKTNNTRYRMKPNIKTASNMRISFRAVHLP